LDGLGLLCFFVPGVVAFAVDFWTGAIYLPYGSVSGYPDYPPPADAPLPDPAINGPHFAPAQFAPPQYAPPHEPIPTVPHFPNASAPAVRLPQVDVESGQALCQVNVPREELNQQSIERAVSEHIGKPITLDEAPARVSPLDRLDSFAQACRQHLANPSFGSPVREFFRDRSRA
jgi:hypothetical protein